MDRRRLLKLSAGFGAMGALAGCATAPPEVSASRTYADGSGPLYRPRIAPIRAEVDRLFDVTVCLRPFRAAGPRLDVEEIGGKRVAHNYGHGGSGWSLSWGSSTLAVRRAMEGSPEAVAVIGCGALGITSAILAQQAGARVTIYTRDLLPDTRSARATGSWTPDSRIALADAAGPRFGDLWEEMARTSFHTYRRYLGLPGAPVEWTDRYSLSAPDAAPTPAPPNPPAQAELDFLGLMDRIRDITPRSVALEPGETPFPVAHVRRTSAMQFNIADYAHTLLNDFRLAGGRIERRAFASPAEYAVLPEPVVINCPGYGARALMQDASITPVRGQIAWLIPQPEVTYGFYWRGIGVLSRRDGIVVQDNSGGDMMGYGDANETPDRAAAEAAVRQVATLYARTWPANG
jgi:D-amino-acid oxidase